MIEFLTYDLKVAVLLVVFYMFYRLMLAREKFHRVNRIVLLLTAVASFLLPLCVITMHETVTMEMPQMTFDDLDVYVADVPLQEPQVPLWQILLPVLFVIGMLVTLGHTLWSLFRIVSLISKSEKHPQSDGTIICVTGNADMPPFSWMIFIVMNRSDFEAVFTIRGTCSSLIPSPPSSGLIPPFGCFAVICVPSTNMRPTVKYSHKGSMHVNINTC